MSWWVYLEDRTAEPWCSYEKEPQDDYEREWGTCTAPCYPTVLVERHAEGGTYVMGGSEAAELNVTYNYGAPIRDVWSEDPDPQGSGVLSRLLHEKRAADAVPTLQLLVARLGTDYTPNYWEASPGNAGYTLSILLNWATQHPDAVFRVS
jgi:hypothetical protein